MTASKSTAQREETWISIGTAARILGRSSRTLRYYVEQDLIRGIRIGPRGWLKVSYSDVMTLAKR